MLIDLPAKIRFGDIIVDSQGRHFLVIRNTYDPTFEVLVINLANGRVEDEFKNLDFIAQGIRIIGVIPNEEIEIRRTLLYD